MLLDSGDCAMSKSPFERAAEEGLVGDQPPDPRRRRRNRKARQRKHKRYQKLKEELQLKGKIPTVPEGAIRDERTYSTDALGDLPKLVRQALKENWGTPDAAKPAIVAALLRPFFKDTEVIDKDGNLVSVPATPKTLNELARTILALDQTQYERENPEAAGKAKGATVTNTSVAANVLAVQIMRKMFENDVGGGETALPPPIDLIPPSHSRFDGEVEIGAVSAED